MHMQLWCKTVGAGTWGVGSLVGHTEDPGIPRFESYIEDYCTQTGRAALPSLNTYMAYNFFRLAAILQGILGRVRDGTAASAEAATMARQVRPLAETAWHFAKKAGA